MTLHSTTSERTILLKPFFSDEAAITDHSDTGETEVHLTVANKLSKELSLLMDEGLATTEVDLLHTCTSYTTTEQWTS
jgi:hypothetical protein